MRRITETHVAVAIVTMVSVNVGGETNIPLTLMHERTYESEVNLVLMGLRLRKHIELWENRGRSLISTTALLHAAVDRQCCSLL